MYFDDPEGIRLTMGQVRMCGFVQKVSWMKCWYTLKSWNV